MAKRFAVFSIKKLQGERDGSIWTRAGTAWLNRDGSFNITLDVLPLDGRLHVREAVDKKDETGPNAASAGMGAGAGPAPALSAESASPAEGTH